ncbi:MAG: FKBP-type peptidyl-prolyl cis-trans isomerase [Dysgonamonadaceae bacterium]|jgi:FKBP-type peptidyl-prolyl cis-trans isomerase SlyD|nr:FKBP-type peptidyl-prolyl cis-trans isomerase [Dysgonamonadaceae bacterium]
MKISNNKFVSLCYDLNVGEGEERELMEQATIELPLNFIFGMGMMLETFEKNIYGLGSGEKFSFILAPKEAYGDYLEDRLVELPKNIFEIDGKFDNERVSEGQILPMMDSDGNRLHGAVLEVTDNIVLMDFNHPLAGETLHFDGEILEVHEPTAEEIAAFTSGCGGGCGEGCSCGESCDCDDCGCDNNE